MLGVQDLVYWLSLVAGLVRLISYCDMTRTQQHLIRHAFRFCAWSNCNEQAYSHLLNLLLNTGGRIKFCLNLFWCFADIFCFIIRVTDPGKMCR